MIEDFEEVKRRRDQVLALTADLTPADKQLVIDCIQEQGGMTVANYEAHLASLHADPSARAQIEDAQDAINQQLRQ